ncbi:MAG: hypothetical protein GNW80_10730 [Asgard group archaeon]|nr:hypothetical protein [Asgard group archaeon]
MKQKTLSKRASTTLVISLILATLVTSAILTGTLIARNQRLNPDYITYQEAIDIASAIPEVATFLEENEISSVSANRIDEKWIVEFYADNFTYAEDIYYWMNYAYVEIDALTSDVLYFAVYTPSKPNYTEQEIIAIANAIPEIAEWLDSQAGDISINAWYDGLELWYVDYWSDTIRSYPFVIISNNNGSVIFYEIYDPLENAIHTEEEIIVIVEALAEVQQWIVFNPEFGRTINYYDTIWFGNESFLKSANNFATKNIDVNAGVWIVDYWALDNPYQNWISITVDDETGEVVDITKSLAPNLTFDEVIAIAESQPEVSTFLDSLSLYGVSAVFDSFYGYWYVYFENIYNYNEYAKVDIIDATGEIFYYYIHDLPNPNLTGEEALAIALSDPEVQDWLATVTGYEVYMCFDEGFWYIDLIDDILTFNESLIPGETIGIRIVIDDVTEEVIDVIYLPI